MKDDKSMLWLTVVSRESSRVWPRRFLLNEKLSSFVVSNRMPILEGEDGGRMSPETSSSPSSLSTLAYCSCLVRWVSVGEETRPSSWAFLGDIFASFGEFEFKFDDGDGDWIDEVIGTGGVVDKKFLNIFYRCET